jgi:SAM-dependent methyltransferase
MTKEVDLFCPCGLGAKLTGQGSVMLCSRAECVHSKVERAFPLVNGTPVIISEELCDTVCTVGNVHSYITRPSRRLDKLKALLRGKSEVTEENVSRFLGEVKSLTSTPKILVIGAGTPGRGTEELWSDTGIEIHGVDIFQSPTVDVVCDGHYLPFAPVSYDGVLIQAVLEHVVEPQKVVAEIFRVLKPNGIIYAETPFMQQVHEGAYDFTRYTVLGHRYLFKHFELIAQGGNGDPGVVLSWSVRYLTWSVTRNRSVAKLLGYATGLALRPFHALFSVRSMYDASSGVYFLGRKVEGYTLSHKEVVSLYRGQFR